MLWCDVGVIQCMVIQEDMQLAPFRPFASERPWCGVSSTLRICPPPSLRSVVVTNARLPRPVNVVLEVV